MAILKNRKLEIRVKNDKDDVISDAVVEQIDPEQIAKLVQDTSRIIASHAIIGVGTYVLLDTFRKVVVKMVPGH